MNHLNLLSVILCVSLICLSCKNPPPLSVIAGVSKSLADQRKAAIQNLFYKLHFHIPNSIDEKIQGKIDIRFHLNNTNSDLVLDFHNPSESISTITFDKKKIQYRFDEGQIIIPKSYLSKGENQISVQFTAGDQALNRNADFLYTLFVPNKAATAFPCFDQPNLKARYELSIEAPKKWKAIANYPLIKQETSGTSSFYQFEPTLPISTYLFAFAVGEFSAIKDTLNGRPMTLYHRETDQDKIERNADEIFTLHAKSLSWLENYTGISYPFKKFDFVLIPAFQFGGMEHPGAIFYKAASLFLDEDATVNQLMSRNSLIAHETAHMWFGDLVTMDWFNDVWLKEVFANFMAAKMVNPNFPKINHELRFLQRHHPRAYSEDRTMGTHPIQQELPNLNEASLLYGRIIYEKAPIVMKQLENIMGEEALQKGLQEYLNVFSFDNASWDDLIAILSTKTDFQLQSWSNAWVKESGMPHIHAQLQTQEGVISSYALRLKNTNSGHTIWPQQTKLITYQEGIIQTYPVYIDQAETIVEELNGQTVPDFILPHASESSYGFFELDKRSESYLLKNIQKVENDFIKTVAWHSLWEAMLRGKISPNNIMQTLLTSLPYEQDLLGFSSRMDYISITYWGFLSHNEQMNQYASLGNTLWELMTKQTDRDKKKILYRTFVSIARLDTDVQKLYQLWNKELQISGLTLSENDFTELAYELAVRDWPDSDSILQQQFERISNPDRIGAMVFVIPALSSEKHVRDAFFQSLHSTENRQKEPWVLTALGFLHHPLRAQTSEEYILPSLKLVQEIQQTGGIFFPKSWTSTSLSGHRSDKSAQIIQQFTQGLSDTYPYKLKNKILQASDMLLRKAKVVE